MVIKLFGLETLHFISNNEWVQTQLYIVGRFRLLKESRRICFLRDREFYYCCCCCYSLYQFGMFSSLFGIAASNYTSIAGVSMIFIHYYSKTTEYVQCDYINVLNDNPTSPAKYEQSQADV